MMAGVDRQELQRQSKRDCRTAMATVVAETSTSNTLVSKIKFRNSDRIDSVAGNYVRNEPDLSQPSTSTGPEPSQHANRNQASLPLLAKTLDRYGVSDRAGAAVASAVLKDYGIISTYDNQNIIDRYKVRRARDNEGQKLQKLQTETFT